ncbi:MAG: hypothetical protein LKE27_11445 [Atopobiaceae bacterium]|jgi:hypothetical protein|nr:hypothetical protein [Atopobiaceae bacterium]
MQPFKSATQILGMQRKPSISKRTGKVAKHRASNPRGLCCEAAPDERTTHSETYDPSLTHLNTSFGPTSGEVVWDSICEEAAASTVRTVDRKGVEHKKSLGKNVVIAYAWIDHPPIEVTKDWDDATMLRFTHDSQAVANEVLESMGRPPIFGGDNERAWYMHVDEYRKADPRHPFVPELKGRHLHGFGVARDPKTGAWCGSVIDSLFLNSLNKVYAAKMRERGWPLLDLDASDFERMQQDDEYRADREAKLAQHGLPTNEYIAKQHLEQQLDWLDEAMDYTDEFEGRARRAKAELADIQAEAETAADDIMSDARSKAQAVLDDADSEYSAIVREADDIELEAHLTAAGEQEASKQLADVAMDQLDDAGERKAEIDRQSEQAEAALAATTRRREDEEKRARRAERERQASEHAKARATAERDEALAAKRQAESDAAKARKDSAEATRLAGELEKIKADTAEATKQRDKATAERDDANTARDKAKAEAEQARTDADKATKQRDESRKEAEQTKADAATAIKQRDKARADAKQARPTWPRPSSSVTTPSARQQRPRGRPTRPSRLRPMLRRRRLLPRRRRPTPRPSPRRPRPATTRSRPTSPRSKRSTARPRPPWPHVAGTSRSRPRGARSSSPTWSLR